MSDIITLKQLCTELKIDPREAREKLRVAARDPKTHPELAKLHKPRAPWSWIKGQLGRRRRERYSQQRRAADSIVQETVYFTSRGASGAPFLLGIPSHILRE